VHLQFFEVRVKFSKLSPIILISLLTAMSTQAQASLTCEQVFHGVNVFENRMVTFELETPETGDVVPEISVEQFKRSLLSLMESISNREATVEITGLKDGNLVFETQGLSVAEMTGLEIKLKQNANFLATARGFFLGRLAAKAVVNLNFPNPKISLSKKTLPGPLSPDLEKTGTRATLSFSGKHSYLPFKLSLTALRKGWDPRFPLNTYKVVGSESPFGTKIENASNLIGLSLVGIGVDTMNEGKAIIEKPMENVKIWEFSGRVVEVKGTNVHGPDPVWKAKIQSADGSTSDVVLTDAIGLRVKIDSKSNRLVLSGKENESGLRRRHKSFAEFKAAHQRPVDAKYKSSLRETVEAQMQKLSVADQNKLQTWRQRMLAMLNGQADPLTGKLVPMLLREPIDRVRRPMKEILSESERPFVEETHRLLFDTESVRGYNAWLVDLSTQVVLDMQTAGRLTWGSREVQFRDIHWNYPFSEGKAGIPTMKMELQEVPLIAEQDLIHTIDKLAKHYGFDRNIAKLPDLKLQSGTSAVGTLEGVSLEESTPFFFLYSRNHVLFLDNYFKGKPHGQYPHIMQWLYLAERYSQPESNAFEANMIESLFDVQGYFMDDMVAGVTVTDFVGQRAPQNPDHVNNSLQLLFPVN
jgi:hypothetical protein